MLAIPHHSQVLSMAEINSKEAQKKLKAVICFKNLLTQQAHLVFALTKEAQVASPREEDFGYKRAFCKPLRHKKQGRLAHGHRESFEELMDTPLDFSAFMMNRLKIDTLTPELLAGPTFELMKGTCKSLVELEYFFEEVYKATTDQLDWHNPEGLKYPQDLRKPLPLIPNSRCRLVIPFDHFIDNDLAYLSGGVSSRTYATSVTKTKAADYGHIKWIEDLVPNTIWSEVESARDVYSKRRIIAVTKLQIFEWHGYKNLDWITVRRDDDKLYTFKEGDYKRLRPSDYRKTVICFSRQAWTNLNVEDRLAFSVSLRMFTRSIVIQIRVEDL
ncbi:hypothetical protein Tco_0651052 [Tanacetum coccineum]